MTIAYSASSVKLAGRTAALRLRIENRSAENWPAGDGFAIGCQVFDRQTGEYLGDGSWTALPAALPPGSSADVELLAELPRQPGRYRVIVSPRSNERGWRYLDRWPAFVVDADMNNGEAAVIRSRVTTEKRLRLESWPRRVARALLLPALTVKRNSSLIRSMVRRDITARYRGSVGDVLWTILSPLLLMSTYFFVFGIVLQTRFGGDPSRSGFVLYFLAGMLPWLAVSEAVGRSALVIIEHRNFVKKLVFPLEILPVNLVISGLVTEVFALLVFIVGLALARGSIPATVLWLPAVLVPQVLLTLGICWFLAALGVYLRDLGQMIGFLLTLWFFLTPICYPEASLPPSVQPILTLNPMYRFVSDYRLIFLEAHPPLLPAIARYWAYSAAVCIAGHAWFYRLRKTFGDVI